MSENLNPNPAPRLFIPAWCVAVLTLAALTVAAFWNYYPPLASSQRLTLHFDTPRPGASEPLIVTGEPGHAEFLYVKYLDATTLAFGYDRWGSPGLTSAPVPFSAGAPHTLELHLPSLQRVLGNPAQPASRLRVALNGVPLLDAPVTANLRRPMRLWFARNPIGGSSCGHEFHGRIVDASGRVLSGKISSLLSLTERFKGWLRHGRGQVACILLASVASAWLWRQARTTRLPQVRAAVNTARRSVGAHAPFVTTALLCCAAFGWMITCGSWQFFYRDNFGQFYDFQALSLLDGRLDVPEEAIEVESFVHQGRHYGYFGVTPALLRLPLVAFGFAFAEVMRTAMLVYFAACLVASYLLLCDAVRLVRPAQPRPPAWLAVAFTLNIGLGSTLFYLGSRAYVYHEAILCGAAFALWGCWCALRLLENPRVRWCVGALACGTLAIHARPPSGIFALTLLGVVAVALAWRERRHPPAVARQVLTGALTVAGTLSFNALSYLKFETFNGWPVRLNVQYDAKRLAWIEGKQFHLSNIPFTTNTYLLAPNLLVEPRFPWVFLNVSKPGRDFPRARMDYTERTLAIPYAMSGIVLLAAAGTAAAWRRTELRSRFAVIWLSAIPLTAAMLATVVIAHRYTADFCPLLICAAALGAAALSVTGRSLQVAIWTLLAAATLWSTGLTVAVTLHHQGATVWGVPDGTRERYQALQTKIDAWFAR